jgi:hypothetical protein
MKKGYIPVSSEIETSFSRHFRTGDPTQDISARFFIPFYEGKVALEAYGVIIENYDNSDTIWGRQIRNERFSRDQYGKGIVFGDLYFAALVRVTKDRRFPNSILRLACKTASGEADAARFTDTPGYFFDYSLSHDFEISGDQVLRPFGALGFYSWQTYKEDTPQNDAYLYGAGLEYQNGRWLLAGNFSGYSGYLDSIPPPCDKSLIPEKIPEYPWYNTVASRDKPQVITLESRYDWDRSAARIQFLYGVRDWNYRTLRFSFIWKFGSIN